jgi:hypothetical protein
MFDPYHKWLGIPRGQRPPTYYQLLGIAPDEDDPEVIAEAALRQTSHVRTYQTGPHARECVELLNEIGRARTTLLDPARRKVYDASLGQGQAAEKSCPVPVSATEEAAAPITAPGSPGLAPRRPVGKPFWRDPAAWGYLLLLLLGGALAFWLGSVNPITGPGNPPSGPETAPRKGPRLGTRPAFLVGQAASSSGDVDSYRHAACVSVRGHRARLTSR